MKTKALCLIGLLAALVCVRPAHAAVVMTLEQVGPGVVATANGTIDLTGLTPAGSQGGVLTDVTPFHAILVQGPPGGDAVDLYSGTSGPASFGSGGTIVASAGAGDVLGVNGVGGVILVPSGYVSNTALSSTAAFDSTTLATLGVTPGTYTWTWGTGANADSLTLYAGVPVPVPEPAPALLLTLGAAALVLLKRIKK